MQPGDALLSLSDAGSWASLASLIISICSLAASIYAALGIRRVRIDLISRATLPALSKALGGHVNALRGYLQDYEQNKHDFAAELAGCEANLISIQQKVANTTKVNVYPLQWKIARYKGQVLFSKRGPQNSKQDARTIYNDLIAIQQQLKKVFGRPALRRIKHAATRTMCKGFNSWFGSGASARAQNSYLFYRLASSTACKGKTGFYS
jgi:hypothetical protein